MHKIIILDDNWMGRPRSIGTALLESDGHYAVVDPGPGSTLETRSHTDYFFEANGGRGELFAHLRIARH